MNQCIGYVEGKLRQMLSPKMQTCYLKKWFSTEAVLFQSSIHEVKCATSHSTLGASWLYLRVENCVSEKKNDCFVRLYRQCFYSKGVNVKTAITPVNTMLRPEIPWSLSSEKIIDQRKVDKFNDLLYTHRETWGNCWMIHAYLWVSFSTGTSRLNRHTHDKKKKRYGPTQTFWHKIVSRKTTKIICMIQWTLH